MEHKRRGMLRSGFGALWGFLVWLRVSLSNLLFLLLLVVLFAVLFADRRPRVPEGAALVIAPSGAVVEQRSFVDPLANLLGIGQQTERETLLRDLIEAVRHAKDDKRIALIVLATDALAGAGITKTADVAAELAAFRATGRKVIAVGDTFSQDQYLLAAQADEIWMHPLGAVELSGYAAYRNYYAGALEKLRVDLHVFRAGTFKSAFEFLERNGMSDADRLATGELLREVWGKFTALVAERRHLPPGAVDHYANRIDSILEHQAGDTAAAALEYGFVDELKSHAAVDAALKELVGEDSDGNVNSVGFHDYLAAVRPSSEPVGERDRPQIGVIVASGMILDGEQPAGTIGSETLVRLIDRASDDDQVAALVLRIDSPGGSAFASEIIREALLEFRASGKPLVVSMGSVAASGGYWIAAPADEIWAAPTTLTGSIGVLSAFPSFPRALDELGIHNDGVATTSSAGGLDPSRELSGQMRKVMELVNARTYRRFIEIVADGRGLSVDEVARLAEGRVWTGEQASANGLVDHLGNLDDAIAAAARLATLDAWHTRWIEEPQSIAAQLLERLRLLPQSLLTGSNGLVDLLQLEEPVRTLAASLRKPATQYALCSACVPP